MSETCWAHKKWNKIASDIKLVFYSSNIKFEFKAQRNGDVAYQTKEISRFNNPNLYTCDQKKVFYI